MRRWDQRLARLIRALMACTVLLFAAHGPAYAVEPARDVSAWLALRHAPVTASSRVAQARSPRAAAVVPRARDSSAVGSEPRLVLPRSRAPGAARAALDERYRYLDLQTLRC